MNWNAGILLVIGAILVVIGFSNSQNIVCQAIFGGKCSWLPGTGIAPGGTGVTGTTMPGSIKGK
jgi:hypothetical protein